MKTASYVGHFVHLLQLASYEFSILGTLAHNGLWCKTGQERSDFFYTYPRKGAMEKSGENDKIAGWELQHMEEQDIL